MSTWKGTEGCISEVFNMYDIYSKPNSKPTTVMSLTFSTAGIGEAKHFPSTWASSCAAFLLYPLHAHTFKNELNKYAKPEIMHLLIGQGRQGFCEVF